ncbi:class I adenylate-forming enzyme family protein [Deinococcus soli (ex Cha et al. 2016)]|uniref:class I adenylate-forming enzyme family protein n=1 Tax=Deinococcus soli (ex Cha et al. 2016) TaxID=1309411 RepID=UPI001667D5B5|nr:AMP-binding protein [Deinococcus soli (ex Cha et al. 2016)]GGB56443.1 acyl-CoA synthetase [Deinococcus soli (ex Cha et al. 2016)]
MRQVWTAARATGALGERPTRAVLSLLRCLGREGPTLAGVVAWQARRAPERLALSDGTKDLTYGELHARVQERAQAWRGAHPPGTLVGLECGGGQVAFVVDLLAGLRLGWRVVPLAPGRADMGLASPPPSSSPPVAGRGGWVPPRAGRPVLMTSGSSGAARLVRSAVRPMAALRVAGALLDALRPHRDAGVVLPLPLWHGHGLATLALALGVGAPLHLRAGASPEAIWTTLETVDAEVLAVVPTVLHRLLAVPGNAHRLRVVLSGSAPLSPELAAATRARLGDVLFDAFGSTELGVLSLATPADLRAAPGSVGQPLPGVTVRIAPDGRVLARGLLRRDWHPTGDLGVLDASGRLTLRGRADDLMMIGGENVWPAQLEAALLAVPGIVACAVLPVPCAEYGQRPVAFVEGDVDEAALHAFAQSQWPRRLRPVRWVLGPLPRTPLGKVARGDLRSGLG